MSFIEFITRANLIDVAVALVMGLAFTELVKALVRDFITPLFAAIGSKPDFSQLYFTLRNSRFLYGDFINVLMSFLIISAVLYYGIIMPMNYFIKSKKRECPMCLSNDIPMNARKCKYCGSEIGRI
jgi:large conductance mechanosensitive channel